LQAGIHHPGFGERARSTNGGSKRVSQLLNKFLSFIIFGSASGCYNGLGFRQVNFITRCADYFAKCSLEFAFIKPEINILNLGFSIFLVKLLRAGPDGDQNLIGFGLS
jgi:hypothetical protein